MSAIFEWLGKVPADLGEIPRPQPGVPATEVELSSFESWRAGDPRFLRWVTRGRDTIGYDLYCPSWTPEPGAFIERRFFDDPQPYGFSSVDGVHYVSHVLWAAQRASYGPIRVETPCPPGAIRGTNGCVSCAPPLIARLDATGRAYCARRPALRGSAPSVFSPYAPRGATLRGALFEWLGAPVTVRQGYLYRTRWLVALSGQVDDCAAAETIVRAAIQQALADPASPWIYLELVRASDAPSLQPPWPGYRLDPTWSHPGSCLVLIQGVWKNSDTTGDTAALAPIPGTRLVDFWTHGPANNPSQLPSDVLVDFPPVPACAPGQTVEMDFLTGEFRCVGQPTCTAPEVLILDAQGAARCGVPPATVPAPPPCAPPGVLMYNDDLDVWACTEAQPPAPTPTGQGAGSSKSSAAPIVAGLVILGVAVAIFAATVSGTRVTT